MGKQYRTINTLRSAISMSHNEIDGTRVGQHPLVSRFLKGVFNNRPPAPKYSSTWDVDVVLNYIKNLPDNRVVISAFITQTCYADGIVKCRQMFGSGGLRPQF